MNTPEALKLIEFGMLIVEHFFGILLRIHVIVAVLVICIFPLRVFLILKR